MVQNLRFLLYSQGGLEGASPPRKDLFLALAEPPLCQSQKKISAGAAKPPPHPHRTVKFG